MSYNKKFIFTCLLLLLSLVLVNSLCAIGERVAYGATWAGDRPKGLYIHKNGERPRLAPNAILPGLLYDIRINSLGFRGRELDVQNKKSKDTIRIWAIGGSTTFDIFARNNDEAWPSLLEQYLQEAHPELIIDVINAGVPGEVYWGSKTDFEEHSSSIQPDYVILYHAPNDLRQVSSTPMHNHGAHNTQQIGPANPGFHRLFSNQEWALMRVLRRTIQPLQPLQPHWSERKITQHMINDLEGRVSQMIQTALHRGAQPILATHALRAQTGDTGEIARTRVAESAQLLQLMPEQVIDGFDAYNSMMKALANKRNLPIADIRTAINADSENWGDATHFQLQGSERTAKEFTSVISPLISNRKSVRPRNFRNP